MFTRLIENRWHPEEIVLVSPDLGAAERVESYSKILDIGRATIRKRRTEDNRPEMREIEGKENIKGKKAIIIDDMIDTGGTIKKSADFEGAWRGGSKCPHHSPNFEPSRREKVVFPRYRSYRNRYDSS